MLTVFLFPRVIISQKSIYFNNTIILATTRVRYVRIKGLV